MRLALCAFLCLTASAPFAVAQTLDKAKLCQVIEMPSINSFLGVRFSSTERDQRGNKFDPKDKIVELQKKLTGGPDDAEVYLDLRNVYLDNIKDEKMAREMAVKAEGVLRPHMQTSDPKQAYLLTVYGTVLEILSQSPWGDMEKWARRAVAVGPQDWRNWTYLAHARYQQVPIILMGGNEKLLPKNGRTTEIIGALHLRRLRSEHVDEAEKVLNEIMQYHDKARELAPNEPARQERRYSFRVTEVVLRNAICAYRNQPAPYPMVQLDRAVLGELQATARLQPDHLLWQSQLVHHMTIASWKESQDKDGKAAKKFRAARPEDAAVIREALGRIDKLISESKGEAITFCHTLAATLCASMQDYAAVEKHARQALQLDRKNQIAWEQLAMVLHQQERYADLLQEAQALTKELPTATNLFVLANALAMNNRFDAAETVCDAGLKLDPMDIQCQLGKAAVNLRKGDGKSLQVASDALATARRACKPGVGPNLFMDIEYLTAIHQALTDEIAFARPTLERLRTENPDTARFEKALAAFGR